MNHQQLFQGYDRRNVSKLINHYLAYLVTEYKQEPDQTPEKLVNKYLHKIEIPEDCFQIIVIPTPMTILDLYRLSNEYFNQELSHYPAPTIEIKTKHICTSDKMIKFAYFLLSKHNVKVKIDNMSYKEIKYIIDTLSPLYAGNEVATTNENNNDELFGFSFDL